MAFQDKVREQDEIDILILGLIDDAEDFVENELSASREKTWRFYNGDVDIPVKKGRSSVVKTEVRDTVELLMPQLMATFASADNMVEFTTSKGRANPVDAEQATQDINDIFYNDNQGWLILHDAVKESLIARSCVVKVYAEEEVEYEDEPLDPYDEMAETIASLGGAEILDESETYQDGLDYDSLPPYEDDQLPHKVARFKIVRQKICVESVPCEELIIDRSSRDHGDKAVIIGQRSLVRLGDLAGMGFPQDLIEDLKDSEEDIPAQEEMARTGYGRTPRDSSTRADVKEHWALREVTLKEVYPLLDVEGTGDLKRYQCFVVKDKVMRRKEVRMQPYVVGNSIRIPHTSIGRSPGEHSIEFQTEGSAVERQVMDNLYWANNPGLQVVRNAANPYQVENWGFGQIIDVKVPGAVTPIQIPFVGDKAIMVLEWLEKQREARTGGYRDAMGLNPEKLRGQTATAAEGALTMATRQVAMYARVQAETTFVPLFKKIYHLRFGKPCPLNLKVNVGLGTGTLQERMMALSVIAQKQEQILMTLGHENPLVSMDQYAYTLNQLAALCPYYDVSKMFGSPEQVQQKLAEVAQNPQQPPPDPKMIEAQGKVQAETQKTQAKIQGDQQKLQGQMQGEQMKLQGHMALEGQKAETAKSTALMKTQSAIEIARGKAAADIEIARQKAENAMRLDQQELQFETRLEAARVVTEDKAGQGNIPKGRRKK